MVKKWGREIFYISCNYFCTISFLVKTLLAKLKNLYHSVCLNLSHKKKQNSDQNVKVEKMVVSVKTFDYYHNKFNFSNFFSCPVKLWKNLKLKFRSKFNDGYLRSVVWKALYTILTLLTMGFFFETAHGLGGPKRPSSLKYILMSYNDDTFAQLYLT